MFPFLNHATRYNMNTRVNVSKNKDLQFLKKCPGSEVKSHILKGS